MIWRMLAEADNTLLDLPNSSDQTKAVLLFIQNNSKFETSMLTSTRLDRLQLS